MRDIIRGLGLRRTRSLVAEQWHTFRRQAGIIIARLYRTALLRRVVFIGVTGSCGKTTTKELIAGVLSTQLTGKHSYSYFNRPTEIARTILSVRPWHAFCVQEIAAAAGGSRIPLETSVRLLEPKIGIVTNIGNDHLDAFGTIEAIAAEKCKLIAALPKNGTAVLNADDERVLGMHARCAGRVITYGLSPYAMLRAENVRCRWPERLSFTAIYNSEVHTVQTQLCGEHWVPCVLAAFAVGLAMGIPLETAVAAVKMIPPFLSRMQPDVRADGVTFIRDHMKAPLWSIAPALRFIKEATANRKVVVIGHISDFAGYSDNKYSSVARQALAVADHVIFVGPYASKSLKAKRYSRDSTRLQAFNSIEAATEYLDHLLQPGDLVLLKGGWRDRLGDIISARTTMPKRPSLHQSVEANRTDCSESRGSEGYSIPSRDDLATTIPQLPASQLGAPQIKTQVVVGLGNHGAEYRDMPHNVGQRVVDLLASSLGGDWRQIHRTMVAEITYQDKAVCLVKPLTKMNGSGLAVLEFCSSLGLGPAECIIVHDDIDLPLGTVRVRVRRSSDGGHRGVRSILQAFRTDEVRRVKIGVSQGKPDQILEYVLTPFSPTILPTIEKSCADAASRVLELLCSSS